MPRVLHVVGARPNFMKVAPIWKAIAARGSLEQRLVHTGQHYDARMSDVFFGDLGMPAPDVHLGVGSGSHAEQTAKVMLALEPVFRSLEPDLVSVVGDVNSTLAASLVASKMEIPISHVEAGLRSFDRAMPEEINRLITDRLADLLLTPSPDAVENLVREGVDRSRVFFVGNVMIDSLFQSLDRAMSLGTLEAMGLRPREYAVCTLHRPSNVDDPRTLSRLLASLVELGRRLPVVFPVHPRTRKALEQSGLWAVAEVEKGLRLTEPMGYLELLALTSRARLVLTDSGGLQEETTALGVPCLTLRETTERPITVTCGTNALVGTDPRRISAEVERVLEATPRPPRIPDRWDGKTGERIAALYEGWLSRPEHQRKAPPGEAEVAGRPVN
ncbi:MAG TPA: UDP-N-acetylglucosamine 2-epimerase (non-hydrolyzing) [Myxococcaceae bacterium]|nr:UDP-N-acetylglucosamine 2-epimerase (non-hydrolyzing) [Myxococcaceae bacterium]